MNAHLLKFVFMISLLLARTGKWTGKVSDSEVMWYGRYGSKDQEV